MISVIIAILWGVLTALCGFSIMRGEWQAFALIGFGVFTFFIGNYTNKAQS